MRAITVKIIQQPAIIRDDDAVTVAHSDVQAWLTSRVFPENRSIRQILWGGNSGLFFCPQRQGPLGCLGDLSTRHDPSPCKRRHVLSSQVLVSLIFTSMSASASLRSNELIHYSCSFPDRFFPSKCQHLHIKLIWMLVLRNGDNNNKNRTLYLRFASVIPGRRRRGRAALVIRLYFRRGGGEEELRKCAQDSGLPPVGTAASLVTHTITVDIEYCWLGI